MLLRIHLAVKLSLTADTIRNLVFFEVSDPDSALQLVGLHFCLQLGATVKHDLSIPVGYAGEGTQVMMCPVLPVMYPNHILTPWNDWGPGMSLLFWVFLQLPCLREGCRTGAAWLSGNVYQPNSSSLSVSENPSRVRAAEKCHRHASDEVWESRSNWVCSVLSRAGQHYPSLGCHLSSQFSEIATWGLSGWKSLLGLLCDPKCLSRELVPPFLPVIVAVMRAVLHVSWVKGKLQLFQRRHLAWLPKWFAGFMTFIRGPCWIALSDQQQWSLPLSFSCKLPFQSVLGVVQLLELIPHG